MLILGIALAVWGIIDAVIVYGNWMDVLSYYGGTDAEGLMVSLGKSSLINSVIVAITGAILAFAAVLFAKKTKR